MKRILCLICAVLLTTTADASDEKIVKSSIKKVTVYSQGAQIFRHSSYTITKGVTEIIIEGVSPNIDPKSLQVKATGAVIILDSKYSVFYPEPEIKPLDGLPLKVQQDITRLEDSISDIAFLIQEYQDEIGVMNATKNILTNNGAIRGQGKVNDSIPLLKEAIEYYTVKMMEINRTLRELNRSKQRKTKEKSGMDQRLIELRNWQDSADLNPEPAGPSHRITITVKASDYAKGSLDISYLVSGAGWIPMYDLRSELSSGKVNLNYKAHVYQNTGVDWEDVPLNISTNNPYLNKTKPTLHPWYVDYNMYVQQYREEEMLELSSVELKKVAVNNGAEADIVSSFNQEPQGQSITADQFVTVVEHMISAEFQIDLPYTIESNGEQHMVLIKNIDLDADYKYYVVPKYDQAAYLVAQITKLDELQLVPAKANIFFDGSYIGETYLDPTTMDDTLQLSLGKDPNIIVKRTLLKKECKVKVVGTKTERTFAYSIEIKNLKSRSIEIVVQDQFPVTQNADIEIEALETSRGKIDERTGIIEWSFTLKPRAVKDILFGYKVKFDKDKNLPLQ
ncbi:MAG: DUF4139 domain-containing protein [Crocinitomicaceae bacterium]|nr:DUF4139 domain-containing protein [Crocinitomicaceae bacterium]